MKVGLIDVDAYSRKKVTFPNLALMKLSAWHKEQGNNVEWIDTAHPLGMPHYDLAILSRVFSEPYTTDYTGFINADRIIRAGSGYAIKIENGREAYHPELDPPSHTRWSTFIQIMGYTRLRWRTAAMPTAL